MKRIPMGREEGAEALSRTRMPEHFVGGNNFEVTIVTKRLGETCYYALLLFRSLPFFETLYFLETLYCLETSLSFVRVVKRGCELVLLFLKNCKFAFVTSDS